VLPLLGQLSPARLPGVSSKKVGLEIISVTYRSTVPVPVHVLEKKTVIFLTLKPTGTSQCCGSELIFFGFGSRIFLPISDSDSLTNILTGQFLMSGSHCVHMYFGTCKTAKNLCYRKKTHFVLFQVFIL
jgi:hypothetical protein